MAKKTNQEQQPAARKPGRPVKAYGRRIQTTIYADSKLLDKIDEIVGPGKDYDSRSEFYHQAAVEKLQAMGILLQEEE